MNEQDVQRLAIKFGVSLTVAEGIIEKAEREVWRAEATWPLFTELKAQIYATIARDEDMTLRLAYECAYADHTGDTTTRDTAICRAMGIQWP